MIADRINVSNEIFSSCLAKASDTIRNKFEPNNSNIWHDHDKNRCVDIAKLLFSRVVTYRDVREIAEDIKTPNIEEIKLTQDSGDGKETAFDETIGGF